MGRLFSIVEFIGCMHSVFRAVSGTAHKQHCDNCVYHGTHIFAWDYLTARHTHLWSTSRALSSFTK